MGFPKRILLRIAILSFFAVVAGFNAGVAQTSPTEFSHSQVPTGPKIWLQENRPLPVQHVAVAMAQGLGMKRVNQGALAGLERSWPVTMVTGDVDEDGIGDLLVGYSAGVNGFVSIHRGNLDAFAPQTEESFQAIARGDFPSPFNATATTFAVPVSPDLMALGDFTGHGHEDLLIAAHAGNELFILAGDGKGNFAAPQAFPVQGGVTDLAAGQFGGGSGSTLFVGVKLVTGGYRLEIYKGSPQGLTELKRYMLQAPVSNILFGHLEDPNPDAAFVAGGKALIVHSSNLQLETLSLPVSIRAMALGSFIFDRYPGLQMALLGSDGSVQIAAHSQFDPRPYSHEEQMEVRRATHQGKPNPLLQQIETTSWSVVESVPGVASGEALQSPVFIRTRVSNRGADDVVLMNASAGQFVVVSHPDLKPGDATFLPAEVSTRPYSGSPIAAKAMRVNVDGRPGIVALHRGELAPSIVMPIPDPTYTVNTTADGAFPGACAAAIPNECTLREAVLEANGDTIMVPAGTYSLTIGRGVSQDYSGRTGALYVNNSATIVGAGQNSTIIQWGTPTGGTVDQLMAVNEDLTTFTSATASISNLTMQGGKNTGTIPLGDGYGGAMEFDTGASGTATLTLTNVTLKNNQTTDGDGGGLAIFNTNDGSGVATLTNCIVSGNSAAESSTGGSGLGGGIFVGQPASLILNNTQVITNKVKQTNSPQGQGGGLFLFGQTGITLAGTTAIHGGAISGNTAAGEGGGIYSTQGMIIDQLAAISNNSSGADGGGIWYNAPSPYVATLNKVAITGNSAAGTGGGIHVDDEPTNSLNMTFSRIAGNSANSGGANLSIAAGAASVINDWWGTNNPSSTINGPAIYDPFVVLSHTASPQKIKINQSTTLTANMSMDNHGNGASLSGNLQVFAGLPVTFDNPVLGSIPQSQPETLSPTAQATATFNAGVTGGLGTANATVDQAVVPVNSKLIASTTETGNSVTVTTVGASGFTAGENVQISGVGVSGYNTPTGQFNSIVSTPTLTTFTYNAATSGLGNSSGGVANAGIDISQPPSISESFSPTTIQTTTGTAPTTSTLTFSIANENSATIGANFTNNLPANLVVATTPNLINNCGGSTVAAAGSGTITFSNSSLTAGACTVAVNVQSAVDGIYTNSVTIDSTDAGNGGTASATLTVINPPSITEAFGASSIEVGATTSLTFTISNSNTNLSLNGVALSDSLPAGIVVATPSNLSSTCGGTATAAAGGSQVSLTGAILAHGASCTVSVNVKGVSTGIAVNTVIVSDTTAGTGNTATASLTVVAATTSTALTSSANPSVFGQPVTFTATISGGTGVPTGTATFLDGGTQIGTGNLSGGIASFTTSSLSVGSHTITANYAGNGSFSGSTGSLTGSQVVNKSNTTVTLVSSPNPSSQGQPVTFTATVAAVAPGAGVPTGQVTFFDGVNAIGTGTLSGGIASFSTSLLSAGTHTITASYAGDGNFNSVTGPGLQLTVNPGATSVALISNQNPSPLGQLVTFTATVAAVPPATGVPTGTVTFLDGANPIMTVALSGGIATLSTSLLPAGINSVTASYSGDTNFSTSSNTLSQLVIAPPQIASAFSPSGIQPNSISTLTITLTNPAVNTVVLTGVAFTDTLPSNVVVATPNGVVNTCAGGTATATAGSSSVSLTGGTVAAGGSCTVSVNVTSTFTGSYVNSAGPVSSTNGGTGNAGSATLFVAKPPTISKQFQPGSTPVNVPTLLTFTIINPNSNSTAPNSDVDLGGLAFTDALPAGLVVASPANVNSTCGGSVTAAPRSSSITLTAGALARAVPAVSSGSCSISVSVVPTVQITMNNTTGPISANESGPGAPSNTATLTVTLAPPTVAVANATVTYTTNAQVVPLTATLTSGAGSVNAGTVTFTVLNGGAQLGASVTSGTVANGAAGVNYTLPAGTPAGTYTIQAAYNGGGTFAASSATGTLVVGKATPTLTWTPAGSLTYGTNLSGVLNATASFNAVNVPGTGAYTATVTSGSAVAVSGSTVLPAGSYTLTVAFTPTDSTDFNPVNGSAPLQVGTDVLTIAANNATRIYGTPNPTFSGSVTGATNGDTFVETFATAATQTSNVGSYQITPSVTGTDLASYTQVIQNGTLTITQAGTTTAISASSASIAPGQNLTLTAQVTSATTGTPTGSVSFYDGTTLLGTATLGSGSATFSTSALATGQTHTLSATYSGDVNFTGSSSSSAAVSVTSLDFTLTISGPASQIVMPGSVANYQAIVNPLYGNYPGPVNFSASGLPAGATASFSPATVAANDGKQTVMITIQTQIAATQPAPSAGRRLAPLALALLFLPIIGAGRMRRYGRRMSRALSLVILLSSLAAGIALTGCGSKNGFFAQAPQSYDVTITATSGGLQHSASVILQVQ